MSNMCVLVHSKVSTIDPVTTLCKRNYIYYITTMIMNCYDFFTQYCNMQLIQCYPSGAPRRLNSLLNLRDVTVGRHTVDGTVIAENRLQNC